MTALPLPNGSCRHLTSSEKRLLNADANRGLVFNKFVDRWSIDKAGKYDLHDAKKDWLACFSGAANKAGNELVLKRKLERLAKVSIRSIEGRYNRNPALAEHPRDFLAVSRFATGLGLAHPIENGFLWHHTLGVPYMPGSSIKGMIRAWADHWGGVEEKDHIVRLFGNEMGQDAQMGALIVFDALPVKPVELVTEVLTPHDGGWRQKGPVPTVENNPASPPLSPGDWHSPVPVFYLAVEKGAAFRFTLGATRNAEDAANGMPSDVALGYKLLGEALDWIGLGAKTAVGMGRFKTADAIAAEKAALIEEVERQKKLEEAALQRARKEWVPTVGDRVRHEVDGESEERVISRLADKPGDFYVTRPDGTQELLSDRSECIPIN